MSQIMEPVKKPLSPSMSPPRRLQLVYSTSPTSTGTISKTMSSYIMSSDSGSARSSISKPLTGSFASLRLHDTTTVARLHIDHSAELAHIFDRKHRFDRRLPTIPKAPTLQTEKRARLRSQSPDKISDNHRLPTHPELREFTRLNINTRVNCRSPGTLRASSEEGLPAPASSPTDTGNDNKISHRKSPPTDDHSSNRRRHDGADLESDTTAGAQRTSDDARCPTGPEFELDMTASAERDPTDLNPIRMNTIHEADSLNTYFHYAGATDSTSKKHAPKSPKDEDDTGSAVISIPLNAAAAWFTPRYGAREQLVPRDNLISTVNWRREEGKIPSGFSERAKFNQGLYRCRQEVTT